MEGWVTGSSVHRFWSKILQMEMAVHTLCSVQCGGLHQVVNEAEVEVWRVSLLEICSLHIHTLTHTHTLELFRLDNFWGVGGDVWRWLCRHLHQKIWHMSMRGWAEGLPCADPGYEPPFVEIISIVSYWFEGGGVMRGFWLNVDYTKFAPPVYNLLAWFHKNPHPNSLHYEAS